MVVVALVKTNHPHKIIRPVPYQTEFYLILYKGENFKFMNERKLRALVNYLQIRHTLNWITMRIHLNCSKDQNQAIIAK